MKRITTFLILTCLFMLVCSSAFATIPATGDELNIDSWIFWVLGLGLLALLGALAYWWYNRKKSSTELVDTGIAVDEVETETVVDDVVVSDAVDGNEFFDIELK